MFRIVFGSHLTCYGVRVLANTRRFSLQVIDEMPMQMYFYIVCTMYLKDLCLTWHICIGVQVTLLEPPVILFFPIYKDTKALQVNGSIYAKARAGLR